MDKVRRRRIADGYALPRCRPNHVKHSVRPAQQTRIAHEFRFTDQRCEKTFPAVECFPLVTIPTPGEMQTILSVVHEVREQIRPVQVSRRSSTERGRTRPLARHAMQGRAMRWDFNGEFAIKLAEVFVRPEITEAATAVESKFRNLHGDLFRCAV